MKRSEFLKLLVMGSCAANMPAHKLRAVTEDSSPTPSDAESLISSDAVEVQPKLYDEYQHLNAHFITRGPGLGKRICLTYDDGPTPGITDRILNELARRKLKATFFMIGRKVEQYPSLAREVVAAGHEVANHTFTHPALNRLPEARVDEEIRRAQDVISDITGHQPNWFRPPYGAFRQDQGPTPLSYKLGVANWSVDPRDWASPGASVIVQRVLSATTPGSIILLHDLKRQTLDATGPILDGLLEKRFHFASLTTLIGDPYGPHYRPQRS